MCAAKLAPEGPPAGPRQPLPTVRRHQVLEVLPYDPLHVPRFGQGRDALRVGHGEWALMGAMDLRHHLESVVCVRLEYLSQGAAR